MNKIKQALLSTELAVWRKKGIFVALLLLSLFSFYMCYLASSADLGAGLWKIRHFIGIAFVHGVAQIALAWYVLKHRVPNYVIIGLVIMVLFFQLTFGLTVVLIANA